MPRSKRRKGVKKHHGSGQFAVNDAGRVKRYYNPGVNPMPRNHAKNLPTPQAQHPRGMMRGG